MQKVFGRRYSLVIGRPERLDYISTKPPSSIAKPKESGEYPDSTFSRDINSVNVDPSLSQDRSTIPAEFREWTTTHFTADIDSTKEGTTDNNAKCKIKIYNLSKEEQNFIKKGFQIILRAGYNQDIAGNEPPPGIENPDFQANPTTLGSKDLPLIFVGEVIRVSTIKEGEDYVTTILANDGSYGFRGIRVSKSYEGLNTYRNIMEDLIRTGTIYGVRFGRIFTDDVSGILLDQQVIDYNVHGFFLEELSKLCNSVGYKSYFCLGKVYIEPKYATSLKPTLSYRNEDELYYIRFTDSDDSLSEGSDKDGNVVELAGPLDGRFNVVTQLKIAEGDYSGDREVVSVSHKLDYEGTDWDTIITAKAR